MRKEIEPWHRYGPLSIEGADDGQGGGGGGGGGADGGADKGGGDSLLDMAEGGAGGKDDKSGAGDKGGEQKPTGLTFETIPKEHQVLVDDGKGNKKPDLAASIVKAGLLDKAIPTKFHVKSADGKLDVAATLAKAGLAYTDLEKVKGQGWKVPEGVKALTVPEADKDYELSVPEGVQGKINTDDPLLKGVMGVLKKYGAPQQLATELLHAYIKQEVADTSALQADLQAEFRSLGENAGPRAKDMREWAQANLSPEQFQAVRAVSRSAAGFQLLEHLIGLTREQALHPKGGDLGGDAAAIQAEIDALSKPNEKGVRPIDQDAGKRARYRELLKQVKGTQPSRTVVGGGGAAA